MYAQEKITPYDASRAKAPQVEEMFDHIAPRYDLLNHLLSLGIDRRWRRQAIDTLADFHPRRLLDVATGTGDFALLAARRLHPQQIVATDLSEGMMSVGREKVRRKGLDKIISFMRADCLRLPFADDTFDAATVAYGVRNFQDLNAGLRELRRVVKRGGHLLIVELTAPPHAPMRQLFWLYSHVIMPLVGRLVSHDPRAYTYLPRTMEAFPQGEVMEGVLRRAGFSNIMWRRFTFGLCTMYLAS